MRFEVARGLAATRVRPGQIGSRQPSGYVGARFSESTPDVRRTLANLSPWRFMLPGDMRAGKSAGGLPVNAGCVARLFRPVRRRPINRPMRNPIAPAASAIAAGLWIARSPKDDSPRSGPGSPTMRPAGLGGECVARAMFQLLVSPEPFIVPPRAPGSNFNALSTEPVSASLESASVNAQEQSSFGLRRVPAVCEPARCTGTFLRDCGTYPLWAISVQTRSTSTRLL